MTHRFTYEQSHRWKKLHYDALPASKNGRDLSRYVKYGEAGSPAAMSESAMRLRTCHSCHEVINKRHPVSSPTLRD